MTPRKTPVLLVRGPISRRVYADVIDAGQDGKHDVTADFYALVLDELIGDDAPNIVEILDGVADGETLDADEREQVRAIERRLRAMVEQHNRADRREAKDGVTLFCQADRMTASPNSFGSDLPKRPRLEATIFVRIDNMDAIRTEGQRSIRIRLDEIGPETIDEWVASALRDAPDPIHHSERWSKF